MDTNTIIEGTLKFRDGKKWKSRWCVLRKLSPVADCVHVQLYRDSRDRLNNGQTKASLSLQHFLAVQSGFTLDKESNTLAILCEDVTVIFAFDTREQLIQWQAKIAINLGEDEQFPVQVVSVPSRSKLSAGHARLHVLDSRFCLTDGVPPRLLGHWLFTNLRKYGLVDGRFCFEGGSQCGKGEGLHVLATDQAEAVLRAFQAAAPPHAPASFPAWRATLHGRERSISSSRTEANICGSHCSESLALSECLSRDHRSRSQENLCWRTGDSRSELLDICHREISVQTVSRGRARCRSCHVRMARSSTVPCAPGMTFSWTMDPCGGASKSSSSLEPSQQLPTSCSARALSGPHPSCCPPPRPPKSKPPGPLEPEVSWASKRPRPSPSMPGLARCACDLGGPHAATPTTLGMGEEYYDTPRSFKNAVIDHSMRSNSLSCQSHSNFACHCGSDVCSKPAFSIPMSKTFNGHLNSWFETNYGHQKQCFSNSTHSNYSLMYNDDEPTSLSSDPGWHHEYNTSYSPTKALYMNVKENSSFQGKKCTKSVTFSELPQNIHQSKANYVNIDFVESLRLYENCKDCYKNLVKSYESAENTNLRMPLKTNLCSNCTDCCKGLSNGASKLERSHSLPVSEEPPGYIRMASLANVKENIGNSSPSPLHTQPKPNSSLCLHNLTNLKSLVKSISDPEINLIPAGRKRSKIFLSRIIDHIRNIRSVTAQEIQKLAKKPSLPGYKHWVEDSQQYHSDDTISSDTMVNTANDISAKNSLSSLCSETTHQNPTNRFLSASEINISMRLYDGLNISTMEGGLESDIEKYKEHLRNLEIPQLPLDLTFVRRKDSGCCAIRKSYTLTFRPGHNRESSSSNDSGVSTASLRLRKSDFAEFEMPVTTSLSAKLLREYALSHARKSSSDLSLPRRSKSIDPLGELVFQFQDSASAAKSTSALLNAVDDKENKLMKFIDAPSTSSGTSDLSDYMDNLSISSYSSNDHPRVSRCAVPTLKPRSGKEYHKVARLNLQTPEQGASSSKDVQ